MNFVIKKTSAQASELNVEVSVRISFEDLAEKKSYIHDLRKSVGRLKSIAYLIQESNSIPADTRKFLSENIENTRIEIAEALSILENIVGPPES